ncbi:MAG: hypothetical protein C4539_08930 [Ignavibacteriales bacterium]|nr:MAG: hypothetical protein C4539_08930 [Ignavibacteriales bacterium]
MEKAFNKKLTQLDKETARKKTEIYSNAFSAIKNVVMDIQNAFELTGNKFLDDLTAALNVAIRIADLMEKSDSESGSSFLDYIPVIGSAINFIAGLFHEGGIVKAHNGKVLGLEKDEVPVIAKKREMILTETQQANLFNLINEGQSTLSHSEFAKGLSGLQYLSSSDHRKIMVESILNVNAAYNSVFPKGSEEISQVIGKHFSMFAHEIQSLKIEITKLYEKPSRAFLDDREAKKIYLKGRTQVISNKL